MGGAVEREGEAFRIELATELATWLGSILISVIDSHCANATHPPCRVPSLSVAVTGKAICIAARVIRLSRRIGSSVSIRSAEEE